MDALQIDIDTLEREKVEMKKRLDAYSKKSLLADLARHASSSSSIAAVVAGTEINSYSLVRDLKRFKMLRPQAVPLVSDESWNAKRGKREKSKWPQGNFDLLHFPHFSLSLFSTR